MLSGDFLPKNPYPTLFRSLNYNNLTNEIKETYNKTIKYYSKNELPFIGPYGLTYAKKE